MPPPAAALAEEAYGGLLGTTTGAPPGAGIEVEGPETAAA